MQKNHHSYFAFFHLLFFCLLPLATAQKSDQKPQLNKKPFFVFDDKENEVAERSFVSKSISEKDSLKILWWNVFGGGVDHKALNKNLSAFTSPPISADMIVLGEFDSTKTLDPATMASLIKHYPYIEYFHYSSTYDKPADRSIFVASRVRPTKRTYDKDGLTWANPDSKKTEKDDYVDSWNQNKRDKAQAKQWTRSFIALKFSFKHFDFNLVPVHLANPWAAVKSNYDIDPFGVSRNLCAGCSIVFGDDNPLANQIEVLKGRVVKDLYNKKAGSGKTKPVKTIVFGDFNMPKSIMGLATRSYNFLVKGMNDTKVANFATFPSVSAGKAGNQSPDVEIDHCFSLEKKTNDVVSRMMHLKGSDHYPLFIRVKSQKKK